MTRKLDDANWQTYRDAAREASIKIVPLLWRRAAIGEQELIARCRAICVAAGFTDPDDHCEILDRALTIFDALPSTPLRRGSTVPVMPLAPPPRRGH